MEMIELDRSEHRIEPDAGRLVSRPFVPGALNFGGDNRRLELIVERMAGAAEKPALGSLGASHDVCAVNCCLSGMPPRK